MAVQRDRLADHIVTPLKVLGPEAVADDSGQGGAAAFVVRERASPREDQAKCVEVVGRDGGAVQRVAAVTIRQREPIELKPEERPYCARLGGDVEIVRIALDGVNWLSIDGPPKRHEIARSNRRGRFRE